MDNNKFLNEKKYQNTKTIFIILAILILIIGFVVGGLIIKKGLNKKNDIYSKYTEENKQAQIVSLNVQIKIAKSSLESKKAELIAQGLQPSSNYEDNESYNLYIINNVLNPRLNRCSFDEYKNNELSEKNNIITAKENEVSLLRESTIPKDNYINLQKELSLLRESTIPKEDYINLQRELSSKDDKIKRLEEINNFFNELQEEQEAYETMDRTPPFRLEKKRFNKK